MSSPVYSLHQLGWRTSYAQHLALDDFESAYPARVMAVHRSGLAVLSSRGHAHVVVPQRVADARAPVPVADDLSRARERLLAALEPHRARDAGQAGAEGERLDPRGRLAQRVSETEIVLGAGLHRP